MKIIHALPLLLIAFSISSVSAAQTSAPLRFRIPSDPATLDWNLAHTSAETYVIMNLMEGLLESGPDAQPLPALASSWSVSTDGMTYTFKLKKGVKWSDGVELEASHFVASWLRLLEPSTRASYANFLYGVKNAEAYHRGRIKDSKAVGVKAQDRYTLVVTLEKVVPHFIHVPTFWVTFPIRPDLIKKHGKQWTRPDHLVTLGPYRLSSWVAGKKLTLESSPSYETIDPSFSGRAKKIEIDVIKDDERARSAFYSGSHDFLLGATTADLLKAGTTSGNVNYRIEQFPYLATYYVGFNTRAGPARDVNFRKAVALTLDLGRFPAELQGGQISAKGWIPPGIPGAGSGNSVEGSLYDARAALARAGYGEGMGLPRLRLKLPSMDGAEVIAAVISKSLREKLGIGVDVSIVQNSDFLSSMKSGSFDLFVTLWGLDIPDPANAMEVFMTESGTNYTGWTDANYITHLKSAASTLDLEQRLEAYGKAEKILLEDEVVIVPLFHRKNTVVLGKHMRRFHISPLNYLFLKRVTLE